MYRAFFRFHEQPFNLTPDPKFLYLNANYREALAALRYGITERKGFVSLIGEAGTGKTTLLRTLLADLPEGTRSVLVLNPAVGFDELLTFILTDLGKAPQPGTPKLALLQALNTELLETLGRGGNVVVLIDEAQDLAIPVLEELRLLSNLETAKEKILQFVLAGQPELGGMLARPELRQLRQRIAVPARLRPLRRREVGAYVAARLRAAGGDPALFTRLALHRLWRFSRGVPRLLNVACDNALLSAYAAGAERVGWRIAGEAVHDLRAAARPEPAGWRRRLRFGTVAAAALVGSITGIVGSRLLGVSVSRPPAPASIPAAAIEARRDAAGSKLEEPPVEAKAAPEAKQASEAEAPPETRAQPETGTEVEAKAALDAKAPEPSEPPSASGSAEVAVARSAPEVRAPAAPLATMGAIVPPEPAPVAEVTPGAAVAVVAAPKRSDAAPRRRKKPDVARAPRTEEEATAAIVQETGIVPGVREEIDVLPEDHQQADVAPEADSNAEVATANDQAPKALGSRAGGERRVRVEPGDTIVEIARRYYGYEGPQVLAGIKRANPSLLSLDVIEIGQTIVLPVDPFRNAGSIDTPAPPAAPATE